MAGCRISLQMASYALMNARHLIHGLTFTVTIGMSTAAFAYRIDAPSQSAANPPPSVCRQIKQDDKEDTRHEMEAQRQQPYLQPGPGERSTRLLQQQRRVARLQSRL